MRAIKRHGNDKELKQEELTHAVEGEDYDGLWNATTRRFKALRDEHLEEEIRVRINNDMW